MSRFSCLETRTSPSIILKRHLCNLPQNHTSATPPFICSPPAPCSPVRLGCPPNSKGNSKRVDSGSFSNQQRTAVETNVVCHPPRKFQLSFGEELHSGASKGRKTGRPAASALLSILYSFRGVIHGFLLALYNRFVPRKYIIGRKLAKCHGSKICGIFRND